MAAFHQAPCRLEQTGQLPHVGESAGLALDDTRDEVLELYGESATFNAGDEIVEPYVTIDLGDVYPILAILDGATSTVIAIAGGSSCGE